MRKPKKFGRLVLAEAAKIEAQGLAHAKAVEAQGLAEAVAIKEKAAAWREFNDAARLQTILEKLPSIIEATAPALKAVSEPLGNIEKVVMIDHGGDGNGGGSGGLNRFAQTGPTMIYALLQQLQALGLNVPDMLKQLGTTNGGDAVKVNGDKNKRGGALGQLVRPGFTLAARCHGLVPWSFTIAANRRSKPKYQMPRACPVEFHVWSYIAANVNLLCECQEATRTVS